MLLVLQFQVSLVNNAKGKFESPSWYNVDLPVLPSIVAERARIASIDRGTTYCERAAVVLRSA
jgi:hypothetical protein